MIAATKEGIETGPCFLRTAAWQDFQRRVGRTVFRFSDDVYVVKLAIPFGMQYLYSPSYHILDMWDEVTRVAKQEGSIFVKCEPLTDDERVRRRMIEAGFRTARKSLQPQQTLVLDLTKTEAELLAGMNKKSRYNIRAAEKSGVEVRREHDLAAGVDLFWELLTKTAERDEFSVNSKHYYQELAKTPGAELYFSYHGDTVLNGTILMAHEGRGTFLHSASHHALREFRGPYAMRWHIITMLKERGFTECDQWGIDEERWPGVTRFKRNFGGTHVRYIGSYDYPFKKVPYWFYDKRQQLRKH
ncbi:MAG: peptidoglycan bridge formation glycyltransferase FemA/FemB family protein [Candidatus Spechtbacterales bacterium]